MRATCNTAQTLPDSWYHGFCALAADNYKPGGDYRKALSADDLKKVDAWKSYRRPSPAGAPNPDHRPDVRTDALDLQMRNSGEADERNRIAREALKAQINDPVNNKMRKAGVTTTLGFNFYDLRAPVFLAYPMFTPLRNQISREGPVNAGVGVAAHWMATTNPGYQPIGIPEGQRAPISTPNNIQFTSTYKEFGHDDAATFTAQFASEGFTDELADEHLRGLHSLFLGEEGTILLGNGGSSAAGFQLGTPSTPAYSSQAAGSTSFTTANYVSVAVIAISAMGYPANAQYGYGLAPSVSAAGLTPSYPVTNAVGDQFTQVGGISAVSAISSPQQVTTNGNKLVYKVTAIPGAVAYAWYVDVESSNTNSLANALLTAITQYPTYTVTAAPASTNQSATATGLSTDNSASPLEFSGLISQVVWAVNNPYVTWKNMGTSTGQWRDLQGASLTSLGHGMVQEIEDLLESNFVTNQANYTCIWGAPDAIRNLSQAIVAGGGSNTGYMWVPANAANGFNGGYIVTGYTTRYAVDSPAGAGVLPLRMHPMLPPGMLYFDLDRNPYPQSRIGNVKAMLVQRDYYSIEWPTTDRRWTFGTYVQEVLAHRLPWIPAVIANIGTYSGV